MSLHCIYITRIRIVNRSLSEKCILVKISYLKSQLESARSRAGTTELGEFAWFFPAHSKMHWAGLASRSKARAKHTHSTRRSAATPTRIARPAYSSPFLPPPVSPTRFMSSIRGMNMAMTMLPTMTARKTIMIGSSSDVIAATALSTSSS